MLVLRFVESAAAVDSEVAVAVDFRMRTADPLADADTVGKVVAGCGEYRHQIGSAKALVVKREWLRANVTADFNDFARGPVGAEEGSILVADDRTQGEKPFLAFIA